jgi:arabinofuranosyltransferase
MDDDAFINLRVVRNWLHGYGLVFNLGERVEAGTSPLWLAFLALLGKLGFGLEYAAVYGGIALTGLALLVGQDGAARLDRSRSAAPVSPFGDTSWRNSIRNSIPFGAAIFAALPAAWDYASSGLETGLVLFWLAASYNISARRIGEGQSATAPLLRSSAEAIWIGLGPLIRPELALYSVALLLPWARANIDGRGFRSALSTLATLFASAVAAPIAYQVFRMAYFASLVPNPATAKEAFLFNLPQGKCYFDNFFGTYRLAWPMSAAGVVWAVRLRKLQVERRWLAIAAALVPTAAAAVHVAYLVTIGGDYMHGRLLVPPLFAALLPVMTVPVPAVRPRVLAAIVWACCVPAFAWAVICADRLRVGTENVCGIGDERGWYAREAHVSNPVALEDYRGHPFYENARKALWRMQRECPLLSSLELTRTKAVSFNAPGCRRVYLDEDQQKAPVSPMPASAVISGEIEPRVHAVFTAGAVGIFGYLAPETVQIVDLHGLAEPLVAHLELRKRDRPGHEKRLSTAWLLARYSQPAPDEDSSVAAARHALHCGLLGSLDHAVRGPLTIHRLLDNIEHAAAYSRLRVPLDPFDAEVRFCNTPRMNDSTTGGDGGIAFRWRCPRGRTLAGLRGTFKQTDLAIATVQPVCRTNPTGANDGAGNMLGPIIGDPSTDTFEVACPTETVATGISGWSDTLLRSVGVLCAGDGAMLRTSQGGVDRGHAFSLSCPGDANILGIEGRSGSLIDALGILCPPSIVSP